MSLHRQRWGRIERCVLPAIPHWGRRSSHRCVTDPHGTASMAREKPSDGISMPDWCRSRTTSRSSGGPMSRAVADDRVLTFDGRRVKLDKSGWQRTIRRTRRGPCGSTRCRGSSRSPSDDSATAISVFVERDRALPDPGASKGNRERRPVGWTQGQFRTRLDVANCLYNLTRDPRLIPIARRLADAISIRRATPGLPTSPSITTARCPTSR